MSTLAETEGHASHHLPPEVVARQQRRAVQLFILADMVFFACMLFAYFYLRALNVNGGWIPSGGSTAHAWKSWLVAAVTVLSALTYRMGQRSLAEGDRNSYSSRSFAAVLLVVLAAALVIYQISSWPVLMSDGSYASMFIVMTWVQLFHLLLLLVISVGVVNRGRMGRLDGHPTHAVLVGYFWYWVALTAVLGALTTFFV